MPSPAITTIVKMIETLPEAAQNQVADHLREYIAELQDEAQWDALVEKTKNNLAAAARQAKKEIADGKVVPMDYDKL